MIEQKTANFIYRFQSVTLLRLQNRMNPSRFISLIITISILFSGCNIIYNKPVAPGHFEQKSKSSVPISNMDSQELRTTPESVALNPSKKKEIKLDAPKKPDSDDAVLNLVQPINQKENFHISISKRNFEKNESRNVVVTENYKTIPMTLNKYVQSEIDRLTKGPDRDFFIESYRRSGRFRPYILEKMKKAGLPENLSWLPLIESGYKTHVFSKAHALGLWQFVPSTGSKFGLKMNTFIDERLDPDKSTMAAIEYLKELHRIFGDWTTVLAAYNCGQGKVLRIIHSQNINYLQNFWDLYERMPSETSKFVPKFLATIQIVNNMKKYGFQNIKPYHPYKHESVKITKQVHLEGIAKCIDKPLIELIMLNPELKNKILPPGTYLLKIPIGTKNILLTSIDNIPVASPHQHSFAYHRVQKGQTLSTIAKHYGTTIKKIQLYNRLKGTGLKVGQVLKLPGKSTTPTLIH